MYKCNLSSFVQASHTSKNVLFNERGYDFRPSVMWPKSLIPLTAVEFKKIGPDSDAVLSEKAEYAVRKGAKVTFVFRGDIDNDAKSIINRVSPTIMKPPQNCIPYQSFETYKMSVDLIFSLIVTQSYSAFRDKGHLEEEEEFLKVYQEDVKEGDKKAINEELNTMLKNIEKSSGPLLALDFVLPQKRGREINLFRAKPNNLQDPYISDINSFQTTDHVLWCPFVEALAHNDVEMVPDFIENKLRKLLGENTPQQMKKMDDIRSVWGHAGFTPEGKCVSHITKVMDIAIEAQARMQPVFEQDVYYGSLILGAGYSLGAFNSKYVPAPFSQILPDVLQSSPICETLKKISAIAGVDVKECKTILEISKCFEAEGVNLSSKEQSDIVSLAHKLRFQKRIVPVNSDTLYIAMSRFGVPGSNFIDDLISPDAMFLSDQHKLLSAFGTLVPSFNVKGGVETKLEGKAPNSLVTSRTTLFSAVPEWELMLARGYITNNPNNLSKNYAFRSFHGEDKEKLWNGLKLAYEFSKEERKEGEAPSAKKARTDEYEDEDW